MEPCQLSAQVAMGEEAQRLLEHPLIQQFFQDMEARLFHQWKGCLFDDIEKMKHIKACQATLDEFKGCFIEKMTKGNIAEEELKNLQAEKKPENSHEFNDSIYT